MFQSLYRFTLAMGVLLSVPLIAGGLVFFLPLAAPILLLSFFAFGTPKAFLDYCSTNSLKTQLNKRLAQRPQPLSVADIKTDLKGQTITDADFKEVHLDQVDFSGSNLHHSTLSKAWGAKARFVKSNLHHARMFFADLTNADFREADLHSSYMQYADLQGAHLGKANLEKANLKGADLRHADMAEARLEGAIYDENTKLPISHQEAFHRGMVCVA